MLELPFPPSLNRMYRVFNGRFLTSKVGRDYKTTVGEICLINRLKPVSGEVRITIHLFRKEKRGDIDNSLKVLLDSLQGYLYENDSQIIQLTVFRFEDPKNPRVLVQIEKGRGDEW